MKKNTPSQFSTVPKLSLLLNPVFLASKLLLTLLAITIYSTSILAQGARINDTSSSVLELKTFLGRHKAEESNSKKDLSNDQNAEDLLYKLQSSIYFHDGIAKTYGENPTNLFTDISSLSKINDAGILKSNIKILRVRINNSAELRSTIDLSAFSEFKNLKYVYIISGVPATEQDITAMIRNNDGNFHVFYKIEKGENE